MHAKLACSALAASLLIASSVRAAPVVTCSPGNAEPDYVVLVDATKDGLRALTTQPLEGSPKTAAATLTFNHLPKLLAGALAAMQSDASMKAQRQLLHEWRGGTQGRIFATSETGFLLYVVADAGARIELRDWSEKERELLVVTQLRDAFVNLQAAAEEKATVGVSKNCIALSTQRANVAFKVAAKPEAKPEAVTTVSLVTGPRESLSLGVNLPLNHFSELKYDSEKGQLVNRESPGEYYGSFNWSPGDPLMPSEAKRGWERFNVKLLVRASKKPLDSYGVAVGFDLPSTRLLGFSLIGLSPFVGSVWRLEDKGAGPSGRVQRERDQKWIGGIAVDFSKLKAWWKK